MWPICHETICPLRRQVLAHKLTKDTLVRRTRDPKRPSAVHRRVGAPLDSFFALLNLLTVPSGI
jgi:hypothetical protein